MDVLAFEIPFAFLRPRCQLTWSDVHFALTHRLIDHRVAMELAAEEIANGTSTDLRLEIAAAGDDDSIRSAVEQLAKEHEVLSSAELRAKWLYLVLAWVYERRTYLEDALRIVEEIYDSWDYPSEIANFVRYMPAPSQGGANAADATSSLIERWKHYLDDATERYRYTSS